MVVRILAAARAPGDSDLLLGGGRRARTWERPGWKTVLVGTWEVDKGEGPGRGMDGTWEVNEGEGPGRNMAGVVVQSHPGAWQVITHDGVLLRPQVVF